MAVQKTVPDTHKAILEKGMFAFVSTIRVKDSSLPPTPQTFAAPWTFAMADTEAFVAPIFRPA